MRETIRRLNRAHYAGEIDFYFAASLRSVEEKLAHATSRNARILDVGCGPVRVAKVLARMGFHTTGVDLVSECIEAARRRFSSQRLRLVVGDMCKLPFASGAFDEVWCLRFSFNALGTREERLSAISEMVRVLAPGGRILIESFNRFYPGSLGLMWLANLTGEFGQYLRTLAGSRSGSLSKGDILYLPSKGDSAAPGYAHIPTPFELRRLAHVACPDVRFDLVSDAMLLGERGTTWKRWFGYSIWLRAVLSRDL